MIQPEHISLQELLVRLAEDESALDSKDRIWWSQHKCKPFILKAWSKYRYGVALVESRVLIFFDDEDEFGVGVLRGHEATECGLFGDLIDAIRNLRKSN